jgi:hypothetical protein
MKMGKIGADLDNMTNSRDMGIRRTPVESYYRIDPFIFLTIGSRKSRVLLRHPDDADFL